MKKNYFLRLIFPIMTVALLASCEEVDDDTTDGGGSSSDTTIAATSVSFSADEVDISVKESYQLEYTIEPSNATNVSFESNDETEVTVTASGVVKGIAKGGAYIAIRNISGSLQDFCYVRVSEVLVSSLTFDEDTFTILIDGWPTGIPYTTYPEGLTPTITWTIEDEEIIEIGDDDLVYPLKGGETTVTATDVNGIYYDECTVIVKVAVESVTFNTVTVAAGSTADVDFTYLPEDAYPEPLSLFTWLSMDDKIATVTGGVVTGVSTGNTTVYAYDGDDVVGLFTVVVQ